MSEPDRTEGDVNLSPRREAWQTDMLDAETRLLLDEDARWFLHQSLSTPCLNALDACAGSRLTDLQGRDYLDFHGNSAHQVGYGHPRVVAAAKECLDTLPFCPRRYTNRHAVALARRLCERTGGALGKALFAPGGTAVVGMALKLARVATGRFKTISWWDSFHGASLDAISVGGEALFRAGLGPLLPGAVHVPPPSAGRGPFRSSEAAFLESADYIEYVMAREGDIAAVIAEPVRCTTAVLPPAGYWEQVRRACDRHGALLIFDEIPLCLGRTGRFFAFEHTGVVPDMVCLGKGLGGGVFPMAALLAREGLDVAAHTALGHYTHEKSPVGCAAALATLDVIDGEGLVGRANTGGARLVGLLEDLRGRHAQIGDIRGLGLLVAVEVVRDRDNPEPDPGMAERVLYECLRRGMSFKVSSGNVLTLTPPLNISSDDIERAAGILDEAFAAVSA
jgi:4-aminobutyrate aminotransferase